MARAAHRLAEIWALTGGLLVFAIMIVTSINVAGFGLDRIARTFGSGVSGLPGYEDFVSLAISCAALMFLPYCQAQRGHVSVDLFVGLLSPAIRHALDRVWLAAIVLLACFLGYWMTLGLVESRSDNVLTTVLAWPVWPFYAPGIVSLALWALVAAIQIGDGPGVAVLGQTGPGTEAQKDA